MMLHVKYYYLGFSECRVMPGAVSTGKILQQALHFSLCTNSCQGSSRLSDWTKQSKKKNTNTFCISCVVWIMKIYWISFFFYNSVSTVIFFAMNNEEKHSSVGLLYENIKWLLFSLPSSNTQFMWNPSHNSSVLKENVNILLNL